MATELNVWDASYAAFGDFRSTPFYCVEFKADKVVQKCSATTGVVCGVIQNNPNSGETAVVRHAGVSKIIAGAIISNAGVFVGPAAHGAGAVKSVGTNSADYVIGMAQEDAVSGAAFNVIITPVPSRAL